MQLGLGVIPDDRPGRLGVLVRDDAGDGSVRRTGIVFAQGENAHTLAVLVFLAAAVDAVLLAVLRLDVAANVLAVDTERNPRASSLPGACRSHPDLGQQHPGGLVLDANLAGEVQGCQALDGRHLLPDRHQELPEEELAGVEDRARRDRELSHVLALRTAEAASADAVRGKVSALRAERLPCIRGPAERAEQAIGLFLAQPPTSSRPLMISCLRYLSQLKYLEVSDILSVSAMANELANPTPRGR